MRFCVLEIFFLNFDHLKNSFKELNFWEITHFERNFFGLFAASRIEEIINKPTQIPWRLPVLSKEEYICSFAADRPLSRKDVLQDLGIPPPPHSKKENFLYKSAYQTRVSATVMFCSLSDTDPTVAAASWCAGFLSPLNKWRSIRIFKKIQREIKIEKKDKK